MAIKGIYISAKEASKVYKCTPVHARRKLAALAKVLDLFRTRNLQGEVMIIPDIRRITYQQFADALNVSLDELEKAMK